jgi:hypothetical protein
VVHGLLEIRAVLGEDARHGLSGIGGRDHRMALCSWFPAKKRLILHGPHNLLHNPLRSMESSFQLDGVADSFKAVAHHQQQEELERTLAYAAPSPLSQDDLQLSQNVFNRFLNVFERPPEASPGYKPITLLRTMYDEVCMKEKFLRYLFIFLERQVWDIPEAQLSLLSALNRHRSLDLTDSEQKARLGEGLAAFADHLINSFFLPSTFPNLVARDAH